MEKLLLGRAIKTKSTGRCASELCQVQALVKRGHEECGDSAFIYCDSKLAIIAVFDGVSGEPGAAEASSLAAAEVLEHLKGKKPTEENMKDALVKASRNILKGYTTAAVISISKDGAFVMASVGDSPIYGLNKEGELELEIPLGRPVGKGDAIFKFMNFRNLVTSVLGPSGADMEIHMKEGRISKGEIIILASDGLSDNLFVKVKEGYVEDASGSEDLRGLVGKTRDPGKLLGKLESEMASRISGSSVERPGELLSPKLDDLAIIVLRWL